VATIALLVRSAIVLHGWTTNPLVRTPQLDGQYYLQWAADIAAGDFAGRGGITAGGPWVLNPLYAYVLAPFAGAFREPLLPVVLFQAALGAATAALSAAAAGRWFGVRGAWAAGLLVAFAAPLAQLDQHVSVAELSAFLVAGACFACAPATVVRPWAAGLWLGLGALARPITPLALPLVAWRFVRESPRKLRTAFVVTVVFAACAVPSFLRNWIVSGEPAIYTAAGGINLHLGNNPEARQYRGMSSPHFRFNPIDMHEDARRYVQQSLGRVPTRAEIADFWVQRTVDEVVRHPGESALFYLHKARWFFESTEVPSSASRATDLTFSPGLAAAFVPTWLTASLAVAGAWIARRRRDLLLGPGALALAHWVVLTLVFPLSHYRAPAIPALAVLAAAAVCAAWDAWTAGRRAAAASTLGVAAAVATVGAVPPGPDPLWFRDLAVLALHARDSGDYALAEQRARAAREAYERYWGRDFALGWEMIGEMQFRRRDWAGARDSFNRALELDPTSPAVRVMRSWCHEMLGDYRDAERDARDTIDRYPSLPDGHGRLGEYLSILPGREAEAREALVHAMNLGGQPDVGALRRVGLIR
jgi:tetratricopeptide (TPR) repeat protein